MESCYKSVFLKFLIAILLGVSISEGKGHKFGHGVPSKSIREYQGFPDPRTFFTNYVQASKPLKMVGAAKISTGPFTKWNDDYFLSLDTPAEDLVYVIKKEHEKWTYDTTEMHFHDFVRSYNTTKDYMVNGTPDYLG